MLSNLNGILRHAGRSRKRPLTLCLALTTLALSTVISPALAADPPSGQSRPSQPNATCPAGGQCFADVTASNPFYEFVNRIYGQNLVTGYACGGPGEPCDANNRPYYRPGGSVTRQQMAKFIDNARHLPGIDIQINDSSSIPINAENDSGTGLITRSISGTAMIVVSTNHTGVLGVTQTGVGVWGTATESGGLAGAFYGNVAVTGNLSKGAGSFKIDDPIDPANKYLYHSFVESPDMMNIYNGDVTLDAKGEAWVQMPDWFQALNRDFRYQLTAVGVPGPNLYIAQKIDSNRFKIAGGAPGGGVSWQVTGIRQDPYANAHRIQVEQDKPANEQGKYLYPKELGQPESLGVDYKDQQLARQQTVKP